MENSSFFYVNSTLWNQGGAHKIHPPLGPGPFPPGGGRAYPNLTDVWGNVSTFSNHVNDRAIVSSGKELSNGMEVLQWIQ